MNAIWFLSQERNMMIVGFNRVERGGISELWIKELDGTSRKIATGEEAERLEEALLNITWTTSPTIISDGKGRFSTNTNIEDEEEVE